MDTLRVTAEHQLSQWAQVIQAQQESGQNIKNFCESAGISIPASLVRIVVVPLFVILAAYFLGFRGADIGVLFILFASPTAISSYIMTKTMKCNSDVAANIIMMTTLGSVGTLSLGIFALRALGLI